MLSIKCLGVQNTLKVALNCNRSSVAAINRFYCDKKDEKIEKNIENEEIQAKLDNLGNSQNLGGFAKAFQKYTSPASTETEPKPNQTFAALMKNSKFVDVKFT